MSIGDWLELKALDKILRNDNFTVATVSVALNRTDPGESTASAAAAEVTGGQYARVDAGFASAANGSAVNLSNLLFQSLPATTFDYCSLWDASGIGSGNYLWGGSLVAGKTTNDNDNFQINSGGLAVDLD
jgi:hypothetical protein